MPLSGLSSPQTTTYLRPSTCCCKTRHSLNHAPAPLQTVSIPVISICMVSVNITSDLTTLTCCKTDQVLENCLGSPYMSFSNDRDVHTGNSDHIISGMSWCCEKRWYHKQCIPPRTLQVLGTCGHCKILQTVNVMQRLRF
jgi:hypothetical protein